MDLRKYFNGNIKVDIRKKFGKMRPEIKLIYKIQMLSAVSLLEVSYNLAINFPAANA